MKPAPDPLERLLLSHRILSELGVEHALIGGWAVLAWGRVRATRDMDWLALVPASRRKEVIAALAPLGSVEWRAPGEDDPVAGVIRVVPAAEEATVVDIIIASGAADRTALARREDVRLGAESLPTVRVEDIIAMKLQAGGPVDIDDASSLLSVHSGRLDEAILDEACRARRVGAALVRIRREGKG